MYKNEKPNSKFLINKKVNFHSNKLNTSQVAIE